MVLYRADALAKAIDDHEQAELARRGDPLLLERACSRRPGAGSRRRAGFRGTGGPPRIWTPTSLMALGTPDSLVWADRGYQLDMAGVVATLDDQGPGGRGFQQTTSAARVLLFDIGGRNFLYGDDGGTQWMAGLAAWPARGDFTAMLAFCDFGAAETTERIFDRVSGTGMWMGRRGSSSANDWGGGVLDTSTPFGRFVAAADFEPHILVSRRTGTTHDVFLDSTSVGVTGTVVSTALSVSVPALLAASGGSNIADGMALGFVWFFPAAVDDATLAPHIRAAGAFYDRVIT